MIDQPASWVGCSSESNLQWPSVKIGCCTSFLTHVSILSMFINQIILVSDEHFLRAGFDSCSKQNVLSS